MKPIRQPTYRETKGRINTMDYNVNRRVSKAKDTAIYDEFIPWPGSMSRAPTWLPIYMDFINEMQSHVDWSVPL